MMKKNIQGFFKKKRVISPDAPCGKIETEQEKCYLIPDSIGDKIDFPIDSLLEGEMDYTYSQLIKENKIDIYNSLSEINKSTLHYSTYRVSQGRVYILEFNCNAKHLKDLATQGAFSIAICAYADAVDYSKEIRKKQEGKEKDVFMSLKKENSLFNRKSLEDSLDSLNTSPDHSSNKKISLSS